MSKRQKKSKKQYRPGVRSTSPIALPDRYGLPRSSVLALIGDRTRQVEFPVKRASALSGTLRPSRLRRRLPLALLMANTMRARVMKTEGSTLKTFQEVGRKIPVYQPDHKTVCQKRHERKAVLFARGIAGKGRRRSPGKDHTYKHTSDSNVSCRRK